jgi:hypothetical protein
MGNKIISLMIFDLKACYECDCTYAEAGQSPPKGINLITLVAGHIPMSKTLLTYSERALTSIR